MVLVKRVIPASGGQTEDIDSSQLKEGDVYYLNDEKKVYYAEREAIPGSGGQTVPKTESEPSEIKPFQAVQVGGDSYLLPELIVEVESKGTFETEESYQRRLTQAEEQKKAFRQQQYLKLQKERIERAPETIVPGSGGQTAQQFIDEEGNLITKAEALKRIETSQTEIKEYSDYLQSEQKRRGISIYGSTAERYEKAGMPVMAGISRVLEVGEAGARSFVTGFGVGLLEDPLGSLANIGIAVGTLGIVPAYNVGVEIAKSYGATKTTPQLVVPKLSSTGFAEIPAVKGFTQSWRPKTGFDPMTEMGLVERGFRIGGEVGTSIGLSYGISKAITKPIISKLRSIKRVESLIQSYQLKKGEYIHLAKTKIKKLLGRSEIVESVGKTDVLTEYSFNVGTEGKFSIYEAKTKLISSGADLPKITNINEMIFEYSTKNIVRTRSIGFDADEMIYSGVAKGFNLKKTITSKFSYDIELRNIPHTYKGFRVATAHAELPMMKGEAQVSQIGYGKAWTMIDKAPEININFLAGKITEKTTIFDLMKKPKTERMPSGWAKDSYGYELVKLKPAPTGAVGMLGMGELIRGVSKPLVSGAIKTDISRVKVLGTLTGVSAGLFGFKAGETKEVSKIRVPEISTMLPGTRRDMPKPFITSMEQFEVDRRVKDFIQPAVGFMPWEKEKTFPITDITPKIMDEQRKGLLQSVELSSLVDTRTIMPPIISAFTDVGKPVLPTFDLPELRIGTGRATAKKVKHKRKFRYIEDFESMIMDIGGGSGELKIFTGFEPRRKVTKRVIKKKKKKVRKEKVKKKKKKGIIDKLFGGLI